jgi:integrase/recombinase XerD
MSDFTAALQAFFTTGLVGQRGASAHTITAYRDTFKMLLTYVHDRAGITPDAVHFTDLNADVVTKFLQYLETDRHNSVRTRNARLAAVHSFFAYSAYEHLEHADLIARVLAIKSKMTSTTLVTYLTDAELDALIKAPDQASRTGRRDYTIIAVLASTGLRISELTGLTYQDLQLDSHAHLLCHGKGRKDRITPLDAPTAAALRHWIERSPGTEPTCPVFSAQGSIRPISRDAIAARLVIHAHAAAEKCPSLATRTITPHTLRHTAAMRMLNAGIDITTIALWLGHESTQATQAYLHADLGMKERALARLAPIGTASKRYSPKGDLLTFLEHL